MVNYDNDVLIEISQETSGECNTCGEVAAVPLNSSLALVTRHSQFPVAPGQA